MMFEVVREITEVEILMCIIACLIFTFFMICMFLYSYITSKLHRSYHKGYNQAKDDKIEYYSTLYTLNDKYKEVMNGLEGSGLVLPVKTVQNFLNFEKMLRDFQNKSN